MGGVQTQYIGLATGMLLIISVAFMGGQKFKVNVRRLLNFKKDREVI